MGRRGGCIKEEGEGWGCGGGGTRWKKGASVFLSFLFFIFFLFLGKVTTRVLDLVRNCVSGFGEFGV